MAPFSVLLIRTGKASDPNLERGEGANHSDSNLRDMHGMGIANRAKETRGPNTVGFTDS